LWRVVEVFQRAGSRFALLGGSVQQRRRSDQAAAAVPPLQRCRAADPTQCGGAAVIVGSAANQLRPL